MKTTHLFYSAMLCTLGYPGLMTGSPSITSPQKVSTHALIELTDDIIIDKHGSPFIALDSFGASTPNKLIITSKTGKSVIITPTGSWDLSTFNTKNKIIEFSGNAKLVCKPGSKIMGYGGTIRFAGHSRWIYD